MSEHRNASARRLLALSRYISALERGDIETMATVLSEASYDPPLSVLLEELIASIKHSTAPLFPHGRCGRPSTVSSHPARTVTWHESRKAR